MSSSRARFVTACQQLLALGVVVVALVPATRVVSLDVVGEQPGTQDGAADDLAAGRRSRRTATGRCSARGWLSGAEASERPGGG